MAKISEVEIPALLFDEQGSAPTTPGTGLWKIYFKSDGLYIVDDAGTETGPLGTGGGGGGGGGLELIEEKILGSDTATVSFTSIPSTYSDLLLVGMVRSTRTGATADELNIRFGTGGGARDTGTNYDSFGWRRNDDSDLDSRKTGESSGQVSRFGVPTDEIVDTDYFGTLKIEIPSYTSTAFYKSWLATDGFASDAATGNAVSVAQCSGAWLNTAAIDSFDLFATNGDIKAGSELRLYGRNPSS